MICLTLSMWLCGSVLRGLCLPVEPSEVAPGLGRGQPCGGDMEGECAANLTCVVPEPLAHRNSSSVGICKEAWEKDCVPCASVQCPPSRGLCPGGHVTEPCGCCPHCARQRGQLCGGLHWSRGYCDRDLTCSQLTGFLPARPPQTGVCKVLPSHQVDYLADPQCPWVKGCNVRAGACDCYSVQTCHLAFSYPSLEECVKAMRGDEYYWSDLEDEESEESEESEEDDDDECTEWSCRVQDGQCLCAERSCHIELPPLAEEACLDLLAQANCSNVTCPGVQVISCAEDSMLTEPFMLNGSCCPLVPPVCTCLFENCTAPLPTCPPGQILEQRVKADGLPGSCCDKYSCSAMQEE